MEILPKKQKAVLEAIKDYVNTKGKMPSIREIQRHISKFNVILKSPRSIVLYLEELERKGYLRRSSAYRGIELLDASKNMFFDIPIYGAANCGTATLLADQYFQGTIKVSKKILKREKADGIFAIQASGNSMDLANINGKYIEDGDFVLIDSTHSHYRGDGRERVLAIVDGLATIKKYKLVSEDRIVLLPESTDKTHKPIYLTAEDEFIINGLVVDVLKT